MQEILNLIERWKTGDETAAETLYYQYRTQMFRLAYSLVNEREAAEEIAQDALNYALTRIHYFDPNRASFHTWLYTITVSRSRDFLRRKRPILTALVDWIRPERSESSPEVRPESEVLQKETREELWEVIQSLSLPLREALVLRYWAECTYMEIADILDCPLPTAQSRVRLAFKKLRETLDPELMRVFQEQEL
ncbi:MAG: sigma-70 family RNA polymerase sigma factor [Anaerolineaceae bacterium]|nr:sigma-70 family RNA polymerase sigma factor [Anaerolineaceae bacterium]